jgi:hypothetical protein
MWAIPARDNLNRNLARYLDAVSGPGGVVCVTSVVAHGGHWSSSDPPERDDQVDGDDAAADDREDSPRTAKSPSVGQLT